MSTRRWATIKRAHTLIWVLTNVVETLCESGNKDEDLHVTFETVEKAFVVSSGKTSASQRLMYFTLAIENAASGLDMDGNAVPSELAGFIFFLCMAGIGYADIGDSLDIDAIEKLISVWRGETEYKGGKYQAILDVTAEAIPSKNIKAASLSRDYRTFKSALPEDPRLKFNLHRTK